MNAQRYPNSTDIHITQKARLYTHTHTHRLATFMINTSTTKVPKQHRLAHTTQKQINRCTHTHIRIQTTRTQTYIPINASIGRSSIESGDGDFDSSSLCFSSSPSSSNPVSAIIRPRSLVILSASSDCYGHNLYYDTKKLQFIFYLIRTRSFYFRTIFIKRYFIHLQNKLIYHYNELLNSLL